MALITKRASSDKEADFEEFELEIEQATPAVDIPDEVHSIYTVTQKKLIVLTASTAALFSPLSSNIYLPALNLLAADMNVSDSKINFTVTSYLVFQAISPMVVAGFSDDAGRRPAYIACFTLYLTANIALAMQSDYGSLLVLRCLQSAGSSATVALCQGVVADVATSAERGTYVAYASVSTILGPTLSPILGGLLSQNFGWRAIFKFLAVAAAPVFAFLVLFFPETCHKIVGNGSIPPVHLVHKSFPSFLRHKHRTRQGAEITKEAQEILAEKQSIKFPNPLNALVVLSNKEAALIMPFVGIVFGVHYLVLATIPHLYGPMYGLNEVNLGFVYIPYGLGSIISAFTSGKLANWNYRRHATRLGFPIALEKQVDLTSFPIERARLEIALPVLYFSSIILGLYGLVLGVEAHIIFPMTLLCAIGYGVYALYQITSILIVDIYPESPATATAANNLIRCMFAAASTACAVPLVNTLGAAWAYACAGLVVAGTSTLLWTLIFFGPAWRREAKRWEMLEARLARGSVVVPSSGDQDDLTEEQPQAITEETHRLLAQH